MFNFIPSLIMQYGFEHLKDTDHIKLVEQKNETLLNIKMLVAYLGKT